ncbi:MAG: NAD(P) transhydrogenase subunit alpha [Phycisphaerales bacterium]
MPEVIDMLSQYTTLALVFVLAMFLGLELIRKVPSQLHTPLMSGSNAISGICIIGAMSLAPLTEDNMFALFLSAAAVAFATINVVGGYFVTDRMLAMFQSKKGESK